jgi:DNA-binding protein HU-beta
MNKKELINAITDQSNLNKETVTTGIDVLLCVMSKALASGEKVNIANFGSLSVVEKKVRKGINPMTQESILIPAKKSVKFKAGGELSDKVQ